MLALFLSGLIVEEGTAYSPVSVSANVEEIDNALFFKHTVERGDTFFSISRAYRVTMNQLVEANPRPGYLLKTGEVISVPVVSTNKILLPESVRAELIESKPKQAAGRLAETETQPVPRAVSKPVRRTDPNEQLQQWDVTVIESLEMRERVHSALVSRLNTNLDPSLYLLDLELQVSSRAFTMEIPVSVFREERETIDESLPALPFLPPGMVSEPEVSRYEDRGFGVQYIRTPEIDRFFITLEIDTSYTEDDLDRARRLIASTIKMDESRGDTLALVQRPFDREPDTTQIIAALRLQWQEYLFFGAFLLLFLITVVLCWMVYLNTKRQKQTEKELLETIKRLPESTQQVDRPPVTAFIPDNSNGDNQLMLSPGNYILQVIRHQPEKIGRLFSYWYAIDQEKGLKKAAIIIQNLDPKLMGVLRSSMSSEAFRNLEELVCSPALSVNGMSEGLLRQFAEQLHVRQQLGGNNESFSILPIFDFLHYISDDDLYELLVMENNRVKALVLSHLPDSRKVYFLQKLEIEQAARILYEFTQVRHIPFEEYEEIASRLFEETYYHSDNLDDSTERDASQIVSVIEALPASDQEHYVRQLESLVPDLASFIQQRLITMDKLSGLDDDILEKAVDQTPVDQLAAILVGTDENLKKRLLRFRPGKEEQQIRKEIENMVFLSREEIDQARNNFLKVVRKEAEKKINPSNTSK